ncbi:EF-hand domain-containing protein [Sphingomonas jaspsi]|uniref:EF-hand domain-containing protein n=1 Tax=Sphingomonas jaspsi TaxID=392409 RepID=UPI0004BCFB92|nr:EF-hand domain-containing protein [Sphingomonas jaspsi]
MSIFALTIAAFAASAAPTADKAPAATVKPAVQPMTKSDFLSAIDARFVAMDTNKDGQLSKLEIEAAESRMAAQRVTVVNARREAAFKKLDTNHDGQLSLAEFNAAAPVPAAPKPDAGKVLARMDSNKDQAITLQEFRAGPLADFDKLDANKDGKLSVQERAAARPAKR